MRSPQAPYVTFSFGPVESPDDGADGHLYAEAVYALWLSRRSCVTSGTRMVNTSDDVAYERRTGADCPCEAADYSKLVPVILGPVPHVSWSRGRHQLPPPSVAVWLQSKPSRQPAGLG